MKRSLLCSTLAVFACLLAASASAQDCPCPTPTPVPLWSGNLGAGLSRTGGNSSTSSLNLSFGATRGEQARNTLRLQGLYLRTSSNGDNTADRTAASLRDEHRFAGRGFVFGEARYLRDEFKQIRYHVSPLLGAGVRLIDSKTASLSVDGAVGGAFEGLEAQDGTSSLALHAGQTLEWSLTSTARIKQVFKALWKTDDFGDALYHFEATLATSISSRAELTISFSDDYKSRPGDPSLEKNDTTVLAAIVVKL